ncbi:hypothetical protein BHF71_09275 [Vulcanibacillus modesticaldus]|uniref:Major facilitator superfamily (MFS) profile domain-containing protein n=1 Tax=Vulcanibacillus modesticaldus TaxID=337097 RepID=A0A1D2YU73_9BACI|nr:MFS transporter [Vulcanibacillus modesticaldus]OEF99260.1 hypothetical protein BHF71_09275 [Vulcanibacillus modesticaldus]
MKKYLLKLLQMSSGVRRFIASESLLGIGFGIFMLVFNLHLLDLGFDEAEIGRITSVGTIIMGIFSIPSGLLANKYGRKKVLVSGIILIGIGYAGIGIGVRSLIIYISQIIMSLGVTLLITSEIQLLFYYSRSNREETQAYSMLFAIFTLFTGIGTILGGYLPSWLGGKTTIYQGALFISSGIILSVALIRGILLPQEKDSDVNTSHILSFEKFTKQIKNRNLWLFSTFTLLIGVSYAFVIPFLNIIVKFRYGWNDEPVSIVLTINGLFLFIGSILLPYILEKIGLEKTYFFVFLSNVLMSIVLYLSMPIYLFIPLLLLRGGSFTMLNNIVESQTMQSIEEDERNLFAGMRAVLRSLGSAVAMYLAGIILSDKNYYLPFLLSGAFILIGYIYFLVFIKPIIVLKLYSQND